jgi:hypothetical protein
MPTHNRGSNLPNQGDRSTKGSAGANIPRARKSDPPKVTAKAHKGKGKKNPSLPTWLS